MPENEKWSDKYYTEPGSIEHAAQKVGGMAGAAGGLLLAAAIATGPIGLLACVLGGVAVGGAAAAERFPGNRQK